MSDGPTLTEVARSAGVAPSTLRRWIDLGLVPRGEDGTLPAEAAAQARVVARLRERGHRLEDISKATRDGRLAIGIAGDLRSGAPARHRLEDVAAEVDVEPALVRRILRAVGVSLADEDQLTDDDVDLVRRLADVLNTGFPLVAVLQLARVYGQALSQIADAEVRLFHLYVHEPLLREGVPGEQIAEAMGGLARELLPLATPIIRNIHRRYLQQYVEQDRIAGMEEDLSGERELGRLRVAIAFADLAGYTRLTEEAGEAEAVSAVERFVDRVEDTLPDDARVIKTIGDAVMVVGTDTRSLVDWSVAFSRAMRERPRPRIGMHAGDVLYRDGDFFGREVNLAARVAAQAAGGEVLVTRTVVDQAGHRLVFEPIGEVALKGFAEGTEIFVARGLEDGVSDVAARVAATGLLPVGEPVVVLLSGGRDSTALLALAAALRANALALHVNHGLRDDADADEAHCHALCERLGVGLLVERAPGPPEGNVQAWARELRYTVARAVAGDVPIATGHTLSDQAETVLLRLAASPGRRALLGMATSLHGIVRPLLAAELTREDTAAFCREAGLTWREDPSNEDPVYARSRARDGLLPALQALDPRAERNIARTAALLREEAAVLDGLVAEVVAGGESDGVAIERLAALPRALGRLVLRRLAEDATGGLCGRAGGRLEEVLALAPIGALDLGDGARAVVRRGVLRLERTPAPARAAPPRDG